MIILNKKNLLNLALIISIGVGAAGFITDIINTKSFGGVDLRDRVVGARVASELKRDPYFYKWSQGQNDRYLDPNDNAEIPLYTRLTVTPAVLSLHSLFSILPYLTQRYLWFVIQWTALIGSIFLLSRALTKDADKRLVVWILGLIGISASFFWRLHVERGQIYIIYVFLFSLALFLYHEYSKKNISHINWLLAGSGLILGFLISLRPPYLFSLIPILIYKKFKLASFIILGVLTSVAVSSAIMPCAIWKSYYNSIQKQSVMMTDETINFRPIGPNLAEEMDVRNALSVPGEDSSLLRIFRGVFNTWFSSNTLFLLLLIFEGALTIFLWKVKIKTIRPTELFFLAASLSFFSEFFIAAPRWPYANVIWLIPLSFILVEIKKEVNLIELSAYTLIILGIMTQQGLHLTPHLTFLGDAGIPVAILLFILAYLLNKKNGFSPTLN